MKTLAIFICMLFSGLLSGCMSGETRNSGVAVQRPTTADLIQPEPTKRTLTEIDLTVNGIRSGTKEKEITKLFGKPVRIWNDKVMDECTGGFHRTLSYDGIEFSLMSDERRHNYTVWQINLSSANWEIAPGLRVGDPISKVRELYGQPVSEEKYRVDYVTKENLGLVMFEHTDGIVIRVLMRETLC